MIKMHLFSILVDFIGATNIQELPSFIDASTVSSDFLTSRTKFLVVSDLSI